MPNGCKFLDGKDPSILAPLKIIRLDAQMLSRLWDKSVEMFVKMSVLQI